MKKEDWNLYHRAKKEFFSVEDFYTAAIHTLILLPSTSINPDLDFVLALLGDKKLKELTCPKSMTTFNYLETRYVEKRAEKTKEIEAEIKERLADIVSLILIYPTSNSYGVPILSLLVEQKLKEQETLALSQRDDVYNKQKKVAALLNFWKKEKVNIQLLKPAEWKNEYIDKIKQLKILVDRKAVEIKEAAIYATQDTTIYRILDFTNQILFYLERNGFFQEEEKIMAQELLLWQKNNKSLTATTKIKNSELSKSATTDLETQFLSAVIYDIRQSQEKTNSSLNTPKPATMATDYFLRFFAQKDNKEFIHTEKAYNFLDLILSWRFQGLSSKNYEEYKKIDVSSYSQKDKDTHNMIIKTHEAIGKIAHKVYDYYLPYIEKKSRIAYDDPLFFQSVNEKNNVLTSLLNTHAMRANSPPYESLLIKKIARLGEHDNFYLKSQVVSDYVIRQNSSKENYIYEETLNKIKDLEGAFPVYYEKCLKYLEQHKPNSSEDTVIALVHSAFTALTEKKENFFSSLALNIRQSEPIAQKYLNTLFKEEIEDYKNRPNWKRFQIELGNALSLYNEFFPKKSYQLFQKEVSQETMRQLENYARKNINSAPAEPHTEALLTNILNFYDQKLPKKEKESFLKYFQEQAKINLNGRSRQDKNYLTFVHTLIDKMIFEETLKKMTPASNIIPALTIKKKINKI